MRQITISDIKSAFPSLEEEKEFFPSREEEKAIFFFVENLPVSVNALTSATGDGYIVAVNDNLPREEKKRAIAHEIGHIVKGHFRDTKTPIKDQESQAEDIQNNLLSAVESIFF